MAMAVVAQQMSPVNSTNVGVRQAAVLQLDLCNYTVLASSVASQQLAAHIHGIFSAFDSILSDTSAKSNGVFKMDTIGDAYVSAAWLDGEDSEQAQRRNGEICQSLLDVAGRMIDAIALYNESHGMKLECRVGIDAGPVTAGMLGRLQPRFHLVGLPVFGSAKLESQARRNEVNMSDAVAALLSRRPFGTSQVREREPNEASVNRNALLY
jgi:class 3 adenylate cyclase